MGIMMIGNRNGHDCAKRTAKSQITAPIPTHERGNGSSCNLLSKGEQLCALLCALVCAFKKRSPSSRLGELGGEEQLFHSNADDADDPDSYEQCSEGSFESHGSLLSASMVMAIRPAIGVAHSR